MCSKAANLYEKPQRDYERYISQLSDEELVSYVQAGEADCRPEAIAFACETLQSRGLSGVEIAHLRKQAEAHASGEKLGKCKVCGEEAAGKFFKLYYGSVVREGLVYLSGKNICSDTSYYSGGSSTIYYDITGETGAFICSGCFERERSKHKRVPTDLGTEMAKQLTRVERDKLGEHDIFFSPQKFAALRKMTPNDISRLEKLCYDEGMRRWAEGKGPNPCE